MKFKNVLKSLVFAACFASAGAYAQYECMVEETSSEEAFHAVELTRKDACREASKQCRIYQRNYGLQGDCQIIYEGPVSNEPNPGSGNDGANSCQYANDGLCDDGRPGADYSDCDYGTDENDCRGI